LSLDPLPQVDMARVWCRFVIFTSTADRVSAVQSPWCGPRGLVLVSRWAQWTHCDIYYAYGTAAWL
jgi:hypothetical protein